MANHEATVRWRCRDDDAFIDNRYSRAHAWSFDGGLSVPASASPCIVRPPYSDPAGVDPEEAFVAALASCHMLFFLSFAARGGFTVAAYADNAVGTMMTESDGRAWMARVTLNPIITFAGSKRPSRAEEDVLHRTAHEACFLANSVKTEIVIKNSPQDHGRSETA